MKAVSAFPPPPHPIQDIFKYRKVELSGVAMLGCARFQAPVRPSRRVLQGSIRSAMFTTAYFALIEMGKATRHRMSNYMILPVKNKCSADGIFPAEREKSEYERP